MATMNDDERRLDCLQKWSVTFWRQHDNKQARWRTTMAEQEGASKGRHGARQWH